MTIQMRLAYSAALNFGLLIMTASAADIGSHWNAPNIVVRNCSGCHGIDGNAKLPYVPRLSGQSARYIERKISVYRYHGIPPADETIAKITRIGKEKIKPIPTPEAGANMIGIAHGISAQDARTSAVWYAAQQPMVRPLSHGNMIETGKALYSQGAPSAGIAACQTCHGEQAEGKGVAPRLAGQHAPYLASQLALFRVGEDDRRAPEMIAIAKALTPEQAQAIAAYLQSR